MLGVLDILPLEAPADAVYGALRARLKRMGQPIGGNDLLIAVQTVALGYTLVTDNEREFTRIAELPVENWLKGTRCHRPRDELVYKRGAVEVVRRFAA